MELLQANCRQNDPSSGNYSMHNRTFNPLVAGPIPARPTRKYRGFRSLFGRPFFHTSSNHSKISRFCSQIAYTALLVGILFFLTACATPTTARIDGLNSQGRGFEMLPSEPFEPFTATVKVRVRIIPQDTKGGTYWHPEGLIVVQGKMVNGMIITCPAIVGHELQHALQYQDGRFYDPDRAEEYGY